MSEAQYSETGKINRTLRSIHCFFKVRFLLTHRDARKIAAMSAS